MEEGKDNICKTQRPAQRPTQQVSSQTPRGGEVEREQLGERGSEHAQTTLRASGPTADLVGISIRPRPSSAMTQAELSRCLQSAMPIENDARAWIKK